MAFFGTAARFRGCHFQSIQYFVKIAPSPVLHRDWESDLQSGEDWRRMAGAEADMAADR
jgi:hypothetical protein